MLVFDGDYPMAYSALELNRDLTRSLREVREAESDPITYPLPVCQRCAAAVSQRPSLSSPCDSSEGIAYCPAIAVPKRPVLQLRAN